MSKVALYGGISELRNFYSGQQCTSAGMTLSGVVADTMKIFTQSIWGRAIPVISLLSVRSLRLLIMVELHFRVIAFIYVVIICQSLASACTRLHSRLTYCPDWINM